MKFPNTALLLAVIASTFASGAATASDPPPLSNAVIVVGDPQLHNYEGGRLFQTSVAAATFAKVAQRPAEMNLLAGYAFSELVDAATALPGGAPDDPVVLLGDGTNVACSGEFDRFNARVQPLRDAGRLFLWAHGNHDTYMMGTTNTYPPTEAAFNRDAFERMKGPLPVAESFWKSYKIANQKAWNVICDDTGQSLPMNKGMWMAKYLATFGDDLDLQSTQLEDGVYALKGVGKPGTALAARNFSLVGRWYPPGKNKPWVQAIYDTYDSYIIQSLDVGPGHRLVLIDSSTCGGASLTLSDNSGSNACINADQLSDIRGLPASERRLVFGGHYPLKDFSPRQRRALLDAFNQDRRMWTYLSAHTHARQDSDYKYGLFTRFGPDAATRRYEINVGSTTDWPMEAHKMAFDQSAVGVAYQDAGYRQRDRIRYAKPLKYEGLEVCRHLDAARQLAEMDPARVTESVWRVTRTDIAECTAKPADAQVRLQGYVQVIDERMKDDRYAEAAMKIMRAASESFD